MSSDDSDGLRNVLAELSWPAPVWRLIAQAHSWGADAESVAKLNRLPTKDYRDVDDVLVTLGQRPGAPGPAAPETPVPPPAPPARPPTPAPAQARPDPDPEAAPEPEPKPEAAPEPPRARTTVTGLTKAGQHKTVGEGLAVGLLALGVEAVTINWHVVESAFEHAWSTWSCSHRFPQVRSNPEYSDIVSILRSSSRRKGPQVANWSSEGEYVPRLCIGSSLEQAGLAAGKRAGVTHRQWLELARGFLAHLSEDAGEIRYGAATGTEQ